MQIGSKSNTYLKQIQSRAKMHEYHVAEKDYVQIEEKAQWIIISAIDIICEFAEEIIESEANIQMDWKKYMVKLRFAMRFFDSFSKSELAGGNVEYFELLGSAIYYLGGRNGSSKVMADNISDDLDLECSSIDKTLLAILRMDKEYEYEGTNELLIEIVAELKRSLNYGDQFNYKNLKKFREEVYLYGSNREVIFSDILIAVIYLKLYNSAYCLLPLYTGVEKKIWKDILNRNTLVKELWAAQKELGENDIFRGKSATIQMPTGSGKTKSIALIIESAFLMQRTTEVMIVTPFRSLCREITDELSNAFSYTENISVNGLCDKDSSAIVDMLFDLPDFGQMSSDGYELYEEIAAHLLAVYFDAYKNIEIRRKCEVTLLAIEDKISHICELEVRNNLCKMMFLTLGKIHMHDWNELHTEYSYKDKMFLNEIWSKYGWLHFKNLLYVINQMHITELLPEIILPLNESLRKCGENYADCKEMIKANAVIINKIITKAFLDFNDDIKCDHELVKAFEEVLETLVGFGMEEAAVILDEFRVH